MGMGAKLSARWPWPVDARFEGIPGAGNRGIPDDLDWSQMNNAMKIISGCCSMLANNYESDYKHYLPVECLERASMTNNPDERDILARDAFNLLTKIPDSADLTAICKRFENLRFCEAVVRLPLQKAQALDSNVKPL